MFSILEEKRALRVIKVPPGTGKAAHSVGKELAEHHEDLSSSPQPPCKQLSMVMCSCNNPSAWGGSGWQIPEAHQPARQPS